MQYDSTLPLAFFVKKKHKYSKDHATSLIVKNNSKDLTAASLAPLVTASNPGQPDGIPICPGLHK